MILREFVFFGGIALDRLSCKIILWQLRSPFISFAHCLIFFQEVIASLQSNFMDIFGCLKLKQYFPPLRACRGVYPSIHIFPRSNDQSETEKDLFLVLLHRVKEIVNWVPEYHGCGVRSESVCFIQCVIRLTE